MKHIRVKQVMEAANGRLLCGNEEQVLANISLDSRNMSGLDLFVPIVGEKVDAHRFICQAIGNGAAAVFTSRHRPPEEVRADILKQCGEAVSRMEAAMSAAWIGLEDTRQALQDFGIYCRSRQKLPLVGITGSVGKTTTREMVAAALSAGFTVYKTPGNSNSQVGVPITIAAIPKQAQIGVIELGMSEPGEMTKIARIARVDCAVMTNIGVTHIEQLGSVDNILKEKLHIQDGMAEDGSLILNGDDRLLKSVTPMGNRRKILYGMTDGCQYRGEDLHLVNGYPVFTAVHGNERVTVRLRVMGSHMVSNALAALAVAHEYGIPMEAAAAKLEEFEGFKGRQQIFTLKGGITVIDDSYNASPVSMKAGLEVLGSMEPEGKGRKIAILADMKELGPDAPRFHREIGEYIAGHPVDQVVLFGGLAAEIGHGLGASASPVPVVSCEELEQVGQWLYENLKQGDCVLFKGSNSMKLSQAVRGLEEWKGREGS